MHSVDIVAGDMSGISDSSVTFAERCKRYGLAQTNIDDLVQRGISTYGQLLFRVASGPSQVDEAKLNDLIGGCNPNLSESGKSALKRLVFEAGTFVVAELKDAISSPGVEGVKRLTPQERDSRFNAIQAKLGSFLLSGPYEPVHALVDSCSSMASAQCITYIPPSRCASREQEIASGRKEEHLLRLEHAALKLASKAQPLKVDVTSELRVSQALTRRGVALEMAGVCSFAGALGTSPVDDAIKSVKDSAQVLFHLRPMPLPPKPDRAAALQLMLKRPWSSIQEGKGKGKTDKGKGKGKGKNKGKGKGSAKVQTNVPAALKGMDPNMNGEPICFDYSLPHGCQLETWDTPLGQACRKGLHVCMKCHGARSASGCDK